MTLCLLGLAVVTTSTLASPVLQRAGVAPLSIRNRTEDALDRVPKAYGGAEPQLSRATRDLVDAYVSAGRRMIG